MSPLWNRRREPSPQGLAFRAMFDEFNAGDPPRSFGMGRRWLAVQSQRPKLVAENLDAAVAPCRWGTGLDLADDDERLFITPSVDGWVLIIGVEGNEENLQRLSSTIGPAFAFDARDRAQASWVRAVDLDVQRRALRDEAAVLDMAAAQTIDPRTLAERPEAEGPGWLGRLVRLRTSIWTPSRVGPPVA